MLLRGPLLLISATLSVYAVNFVLLEPNLIQLNEDDHVVLGDHVHQMSMVNSDHDLFDCAAHVDIGKLLTRNSSESSNSVHFFGHETEIFHAIKLTRYTPPPNYHGTDSLIVACMEQGQTGVAMDRLWFENLDTYYFADLIIHSVEDPPRIIHNNHSSLLTIHEDSSPIPLLESLWIQDADHDEELKVLSEHSEEHYSNTILRLDITVDHGIVFKILLDNTFTVLHHSPNYISIMAPLKIINDAFLGEIFIEPIANWNGQGNFTVNCWNVPLDSRGNPEPKPHWLHDSKILKYAVLDIPDPPTITVIHQSIYEDSPPTRVFDKAIQLTDMDDLARTLIYTLTLDLSAWFVGEEYWHNIFESNELGIPVEFQNRTLIGKLDHIQAELSNILFKIRPNWFGRLEFTINLVDSTELSTTKHLHISVLAVNDAPQLVVKNVNYTSNVASSTYKLDHVQVTDPDLFYSDLLNLVPLEQRLPHSFDTYTVRIQATGGTLHWLDFVVGCFVTCELSALLEFRGTLAVINTALKNILFRFDQAVQRGHVDINIKDDQELNLQVNQTLKFKKMAPPEEPDIEHRLTLNASKVVQHIKVAHHHFSTSPPTRTFKDEPYLEWSVRSLAHQAPVLYIHEDERLFLRDLKIAAKNSSTIFSVELQVNHGRLGLVNASQVFHPSTPPDSIQIESLKCTLTFNSTVRQVNLDLARLVYVPPLHQFGVDTIRIPGKGFIDVIVHPTDSPPSIYWTDTVQTVIVREDELQRLPPFTLGDIDAETPQNFNQQDYVDDPAVNPFLWVDLSLACQHGTLNLLGLGLFKHQIKIQFTGKCSIRLVSDIFTINDLLAWGIEYEGHPDFFGFDTLLIQSKTLSNDHSQTSQLSIIVQPINDPPFIEIPSTGYVYVYEDMTKDFSGIQVGDVDQDELVLEIEAIRGQVSLSKSVPIDLQVWTTTKGLSLRGNSESINTVLDDGLIYTSDLNFHSRSPRGTEILNVTVTDIHNATTFSAIPIVVESINDAPVLMHPLEELHSTRRTKDEISPIRTNCQVWQVDEDELTPVLGLRVRDIDAIHELQISLNTTNGGTLRFQHLSRLSAPSSSIEMRGFVGEINSALGNLHYQSAPDYYGPDSLIVYVSDLGSSGYSADQIKKQGKPPHPFSFVRSEPLTDTLTIPIMVMPAIDAPVPVVPQELVIREDTPTLLFNRIGITHADGLDTQVVVNLKCDYCSLVFGGAPDFVSFDNDVLTFQFHVMGKASVREWNRVLANITYIPHKDWNNDRWKYDEFVLSVRNAHDSGALIVSEMTLVDVQGVNDPPTFELIELHSLYQANNILDSEHFAFATDQVIVNEDEDIRIDFVTIVDHDFDANPGWNTQACVFLKISIQAYNGTLFVSKMGGMRIHKDTPSRFVFEAPLQVANRALATLLYRGHLNYNGDGKLEIHVNDNGCGGTAKAQTFSSTLDIPISVLPVKDDPYLIVPYEPINCPRRRFCSLAPIQLLAPDFDNSTVIQVEMQVQKRVGSFLSGEIPSSVKFTAGNPERDSYFQFTSPCLEDVNRLLARFNYLVERHERLADTVELSVTTHLRDNLSFNHDGPTARGQVVVFVTNEDVG